VTAVGAVNVGAVVFPDEAPPVGKEFETVPAVATRSAASVADETNVEEISVDDGVASSIAIVLLVAELVPILAIEILLKDILEDDKVAGTRELVESVLDEDEDVAGADVDMAEDGACEDDVEDGTAATEVEEGAASAGGP
jgi:hypothetical protein